MEEPKYKVGDQVVILIDYFNWDHPYLGPVHTIFDKENPCEVLHVYTENGKPQYELDGYCELLFDDEDLKPFEQ